MLRTGTAFYIAQHSDWECAGSAENLDSALRDFERLAGANAIPLLVISDLNFSGENTGFSYIEKIRSFYPGIKIIVYSMFFAAGMVQSAIQSGASGYVSKNANTADLLLCMEKALDGELFVQEELQENLTKYQKLTDALTKREKQVMELLLRRLSNEQIADALGIKKRAVDNYVSSIYEKTSVNDRERLIKKYGL